MIRQVVYKELGTNPQPLGHNVTVLTIITQQPPWRTATGVNKNLCFFSKLASSHPSDRAAEKLLKFANLTSDHFSTQGQFFYLCLILIECRPDPGLSWSDSYNKMRKNQSTEKNETGLNLLRKIDKIRRNFCFNIPNVRYRKWTLFCDNKRFKYRQCRCRRCNKRLLFRVEQLQSWF